MMFVGRAFHNSDNLELIALTPDRVLERGPGDFPQAEARMEQGEDSGVNIEDRHGDESAW